MLEKIRIKMREREREREFEYIFIMTIFSYFNYSQFIQKQVIFFFSHIHLKSQLNFMVLT